MSPSGNETELVNEWELYRQMYTIRHTEETLLDLFSQGVLFGTVHTCIGQEACAVGVINALDRNIDVIWSNHRGHGHYLAYCDDVEGLIAEVMGKETGVCRGVGGSQHLHRKNFYTNGVLGGTTACAAGSALAEKARKTNAITVTFLGDGAMGEGVIYETLNMASLWNLPILFVLEHNQYAQSTPTILEHAGSVEKRPEVFNIKTQVIKADQVTTVLKAAHDAVSYIRSHNRPAFLALHTYRFAPHSKGDDFRDPTEIQIHRQIDPLLHLRWSLEQINSKRLSILEQDCRRRVQTAVQTAQQAPFLSAENFIRGAEQW
ncbi:MAG: thiamine pyrophosphate-dependent dehydrogenase E1 component subunit alpha [Anaerolineae bacterium]|nr:thiamine pyrophosphate-dependent dehydrogenase E1 component subunit alpha [Anaerolineae bacterium]